MQRWKRMCAGLAGGLTGVLGWLWLNAIPAQPRAWMENLPRPLILAHQGGEKEWPSNTMYAFERAYQTGCGALDVDLQMSRDGVLVLIHDTTVDRTTDGSGKVAEMTWAELEKLDAAYHFTLDEGKSYPLRGQGIRIARLDEVLTRFPEWRVQIEVKEAPLAIADRLAELLRGLSAQERVLLSSFKPELMAELRRALPEVASSATPAEIRTLVLASWLHLEGLISPDYCAFQIPLEHSGIRLLTPRTVAAAHARGVTVLPWTIDTPEDLEICQQAGVDGINTNYPSTMQGLRASWLLSTLP